MAGYIGSTPVPQGIQEQQSFTATAGQTTFNTLGYTDGNTIRVTLNGVLLEGAGVDYTATNGSDIVLTAAASADDVLTFETFNEFTLVGQALTTPTISGGTLKSNVTLKNDTEQDTDGGRASKIIYQGEQSGGEISTLAEIQASHDGTADDEKGDLIFRTNDGSDGTSPTEAMRIDSSRNVLIGTATPNPTSSSVNTAGQEFSTTGGVRSTVASNAAATFNRKTDDGAAVLIRKDGTTIGSIGNAATTLDVSSTGDFMQFTNANNQIAFGSATTPALAGNGSANDDAIDLGRTNRRWRNLYLSGGAYIGGTGAANKLEDYEEGTWTPTILHGTVTASLAWYVKVGKLVTISCKLDAPSDRTSGNSVSIGGVPFASKATAHTAQGSMIASYLGGGPYAPYISTASSTIYFYTQSSSGFYAMLHNNFNNVSATIYFTLTYHTQ